MDIVYSNGVLHHTPNTLKTFGEVVRVLKPSGKAVLGLYSTYSPHFIVEKLIGSVKALLNEKHHAWYEYGVSSWITEGSNNPWTKTFSKSEIKGLLVQYPVENLVLRKNGFVWGNAIPVFGKYIDQTYLGKKLSKYLHGSLGAMWIISFNKK